MDEFSALVFSPPYKDLFGVCHPLVSLTAVASLLTFPSSVHSSFCLFICLPGIHSRLLVQLQRKEVKEGILYDYYYFGDRVFLCRAC